VGDELAGDRRRQDRFAGSDVGPGPVGAGQLIENLQSALEEALEMNRAEARAAAGASYEEVAIPA